MPGNAAAMYQSRVATHEAPASRLTKGSNPLGSSVISQQMDGPHRIAALNHDERDSQYCGQGWIGGDKHGMLMVLCWLTECNSVLMSPYRLDALHTAVCLRGTASSHCPCALYHLDISATFLAALLVGCILQNTLRIARQDVLFRVFTRIFGMSVTGSCVGLSTFRCADLLVSLLFRLRRLAACVGSRHLDWHCLMMERKKVKEIDWSPS